MRWQDQLWWLQRTLISQRRRSLLTIIGFAVGIMTIALLSSLGEGVRLYVIKEFTQFGSHILGITPGKTNTLGLSGTLQTVRPLSLEDASSLLKIDGVEQVVPVIFGSAQVKSNNRSRNTDIAGVGPDAQKAWQLTMQAGKFLPADNWFTARPTVVLGSKLKQELFANQNAIGQRVQIGGNRYRVVGVTDPKGQFLGFDMDDIAYIPTLRGQQLFNRESLMEIDIFYAPNRSQKYLIEAIKNRLIERHGEEDFTIITQDEMLKTMDKILTVLKLAAAGLGIISLIVGAVGIITILFISVAERRAEIGLLCSLGATPQIIRKLFLYEAISLAMIGALLGLLLSIVIVFTLTTMIPKLPLFIDQQSILISLLLSAVIGYFAGVKPASQAAKLKPIEALRAE